MVTIMFEYNKEKYSYKNIVDKLLFDNSSYIWKTILLGFGDAEFYPNRIEEKGLEIACYGKGIRPGQLIRTDSIYLSEQSAIQHEIDILIDKLPTEKDKDNLYILLNDKVKDNIKKQLKSPDDAIISNDIYIGDDGKIHVDSTVKAKNSFGVYVLDTYHSIYNRK